MGMINLVGPEQKKDIRMARVNVMLLHYSTALLSLALLIGLIYGIGFWIVGREKAAVDERLASQTEQSQAYAAVEKEADSFRQNLSVAKSILSKEISYSEFLVTLANDLPSGTVITNLSLGSAPVAGAAAAAGTTLDARTSSYAKVLELKSKLEDSSLFEDVNITSATRPVNISLLTGLEAKYPYEVSYNVKMSKKASTGAAR
jgi:Tfp pilus assembly protein PilN